jgi:hypothetical protein
VLVKVIDNAVAAFLKYRNDASTFAIEKAAEALAATTRPAPHRVLRRRQLRRGGARCAAQVLPLGVEHHLLQLTATCR